MSKRITYEEFLEQAHEAHGDEYIYDENTKKEYHFLNSKIPIICKKHGVFIQNAYKHINGQGCPKCADEKRNGNKRLTLETVIDNAIKIHGDKYDYSEIKEYKNIFTKMPIICKIHGVFYQNYYHHVIRGHGCPICGAEQSHKTQTKTYEEYEELANKVHNGKYTYHNDYTTSKSKIRITCPIHGDFEQEAQSHLQGHGCPKCGAILSKPEEEIYQLVSNIVGEENVQRNTFKVLNGKELDIFIPSLNLAIEFDGLKWHSEQYGKDRNYHLNKLNGCNEKNIKLIHIFEDEYANSKSIVESKLKYFLKAPGELKKVSARKCTIKAINKAEAELFLNNNHIQGFTNSSIYLGCFNNDALIGVMTLTEESKDNWNLTRFATDINCICRGVGSKMFNYFVKQYNPTEVKSFADRRWTLDKDDNLYTKLGFTLDSILKPDYKYFNADKFRYKRIHKFNFRKERLSKKYGFPLTMTESEMAEKLGFYKVWDCGLFKYVWHK